MSIGEITLTWDDSFAIAQELSKTRPGINLEEVSLLMIYELTIDLPGFADDPELANDAILEAILKEWFEEAVQK
ncbi:MAG: Fe-S cluster assembly protein IscX [Anaerolineales bacterium]